MMIKTMTNRPSRTAPVVLVAALLGGLVFGLHAGARADAPGRHSGYVHAYYELNDARGWLNLTGDKDLVASEKAAIFNIDKAMYEIKVSGTDVKKNWSYHPAIDASAKQQGLHQGRLHRALGLILSARKEMAYQEDNKAARGWRMVALRHMDASITILRQAIQDIGRDS